MIKPETIWVWWNRDGTFRSMTTDPLIGEADENAVEYISSSAVDKLCDKAAEDVIRNRRWDY